MCSNIWQFPQLSAEVLSDVCRGGGVDVLVAGDADREVLAAKLREVTWDGIVTEIFAKQPLGTVYVSQSSKITSVGRVNIR